MENISVYTVEKSEIRILHTGDTHLGSRQYHSDVRRRDFFDSFDQVIRDAIENEMDAVIHTGDLFDSRNPTIEDLIDTIAILTRLKKAGIPFLGIVGNHEIKQNTQWLDIFQTMGLAKRLGGCPVIVEGKSSQIRFYGIDNLSGPRLAAFDFSIFETDPKCGGDGKKIYNVLMLHQLLEPVLTGQPLSCDDFTCSIPIQFDAVLLGDNHKYECIKHNGSWLTYAGSTERCSAAEVEPRAYNILTFDETEISITRRTIPTRDFVTIKVESDEQGEIKIEEIYSKIDSYSEKINGAVVFVEFSGIKKTLIPISEIEEYVKNKGAVVARVGDKRDLEKDNSDTVRQIIFRDPDEVVAQELRRLNLTEAGLMLDSIIRDTDTSKTNVSDVSETQLKDYLDSREFKEEYRRGSIYLYDADFEPDEEGIAVAAEVDIVIEVDVMIETDIEINAADTIEMIKHIRHAQERMAEDAPQVYKEGLFKEEIPISQIFDELKAEEAEAVFTNPLRKEKEPEKAKPHSKPRQYTLGDLFGKGGEE
ncbi:MAG: exonuclease SbcCD subunit D [Methanosarcinales archaeon]|jgi:DNA repair exonuclease SbcCD nuclease subunit|nr:exonuclease SbcCD subunit D [Methanosarcinales archaeon]